MDLARLVGKNRERLGDPVTALYLPKGFVVAWGFPLGKIAIAWAARLVYDERTERLTSLLAEHGAETMESLELLDRCLRHMDRKEGEDKRWLSSRMRHDGLKIYVRLQRGTAANIIVRPGNQERDKTSVPPPPLVAIEWETNAPDGGKFLKLPETFASAVRSHASAWEGEWRGEPARPPELTSTYFVLQEPALATTEPEPSLCEFSWPADKGGIVRFPYASEASEYFATLPTDMAANLVGAVHRHPHAVRCGDANHYLANTSPRSLFQKF